MKRNLSRFLSLLLLLMVGTSGVWAAETVTYTVTSKDAVSTVGTAPKGSSATYSQTYGTACQMTSSNTVTLTLSGYDGKKITGLSVSMKSNTSRGSGYLSAKVGSTTFASIGSSTNGLAFSNDAWNGSYTTSYTNIKPSVTATSVKEEEKITILIGATTNSLYCESFTLTYEDDNVVPEEKKLTAIAVSGTPTKTSYNAGEAFDPVGLKVTGTYSNKSEATLTEGIEWTINPEILTAGTTSVEVTASVGNVTSDAFTVNGLTVAAAKTLIGIEVTGTPAEFWRGDAFNHDDMKVTAFWDDDSETDVTDEATYSGYERDVAGEQTITVNYQNESTSYKIYVKSIANDMASAYTVQEAIALYNAGKDLTTGVFVKGTVSQMYSKSVNNRGQISFYISEDGTTESQQFEFYGCLNLGGKAFTDIDQVSVGDDVIGYGTLTQYNGTYELAAGCNLISQVRMPEFEIADIVIQEDEELQPKISTNIKGEYLIEYVSDNEEVILAADDELLVMGLGTANITATIIADGYKEAQTTFSIEVKSASQLSSIELSGEYPTVFDQYAPFSTEGLVVTARYTNGDESIVTAQATVTGYDTYTPGLQTVTVSYTYNEITKTATYDITVNEKSDYLTETFANNASLGGNDGDFAHAGYQTPSTDNKGWSFSYGYDASECVKLGTSSDKGSAVTPTLAFTGNARLTFRAAPWEDEPNLNLLVSVSEGTIGIEATKASATKSVSVKMNKAGWKTFNLFIANVTTETKITIAAASASKNRFYLDDVKVEKFAFTTINSLTIDTEGYKSEYLVGEKFDTTSISLIALMENGLALDMSDSTQWTVNPAVLTAVGVQDVEITADYEGHKASTTVSVTVNRKASDIAIDDVTMGYGQQLEIVATTTPADAELTYEVVEGSDVVAVKDGKLIALKAGTAQVKATYAGNDEYAATEKTFSVTVDAFIYATISSFKELSGNIDSKLTYAAVKGASATAPVLDNGALKLYQNGAYVTIAGEEGVTIAEVSIKVGSNNTTIGYAVDNAPAPTQGGTAVNKNSEYAIRDLACNSISIYNLGTTKDNRLYIASIKVKYTLQQITLNDLTINTDNAKTEYWQDEEFTSEGVVVTASTSDGNKDVTSKAVFSEPDMSTVGRQSVTVSYELQGQTASAQYDIVVKEVLLDHITLSGNYKTHFEGNEEFSAKGLVVKAVYNSGKEEDVTAQAEISAPDMTQVGDWTVTVSYGGKEATYTITIIDPNVLLCETFDQNNGSGANDDLWSGSIATNKLVTDNAGWTMANGTGANQCAKFGTGSKQGSAQTPALAIDGAAMVTFRAAAWGTETGTINVATTSGSVMAATADLANSAWGDYTVWVYGVTASARLTFTASQKRFFLDEVQVTQGYHRAITLAEGETAKWATICLPNAVAADAHPGTEFYSVLGVTKADGVVTNIVLGLESGKLEAGKPYIIKASGHVVCAYEGLSAAAAVPAVGLVGNLEAEPLALPTGAYILSGNKLHQILGEANATVGKNKAYINLEGVEEYTGTMEASMVRLSIDGFETALKQVNVVKDCDVVFDLMGNRVSHIAHPGIYIKNGKKIMIR